MEKTRQRVMVGLAFLASAAALLGGVLDCALGGIDDVRNTYTGWGCDDGEIVWLEILAPIVFGWGVVFLLGGLLLKRSRLPSELEWDPNETEQILDDIQSD